MLPDFVPSIGTVIKFFLQKVALFSCESNVFSFEGNNYLGCPPLRFWEWTTVVLSSTVEVARDVVHSAASLGIGPDFAYKGQVDRDKTLFFPKPFVLFPESVGWS